MKRSIGIGIVIAISAILLFTYFQKKEKDRNDREQAARRSEEIKEYARKAAISSVAERMSGYYEGRISITQKRIQALEQEVREAKTAGEAALAVENLRDAKSELKEYQAELNEGVE